MRAIVTIKKSFDDTNQFSKDWKYGDLEWFFEEEGEYLDELCKLTEAEGKLGQGFTVTYTVTVTK